MLCPPFWLLHCPPSHRVSGAWSIMPSSNFAGFLLTHESKPQDISFLCYIKDCCYIYGFELLRVHDCWNHNIFWVEWQHPDLCVTSEDKVLDAVMLWAANRDEIHGWDDANCNANNLEQDHLFGQREEDLESLLPLVHFPFISLPVLEMVGQLLSSSVQGDVIFGFEWLMRRYLRNIALACPRPEFHRKDVC